MADQPSSTIRLAALQMVSGPDVTANLREADRLVASAADRGASLAVLPENFALMGMHQRDKLAVAEDDGAGPIQDALAAMAERHRLWLVGGTIPIKGADDDHARAACIVFDDRGMRRARYDKIHLFDVSVSEGETYLESATLEAGSTPVVVDTPFGRLGLAVCYDLRFPELFRALSARGMDLCAVPSAFTAATGEAHWRVLVQARAVENLCYVVAPNQGGRHPNGRETHGESVVVGPWGEVLDSLARGPGVAVADYDPHRLRALRERFPVLAHRRL